MSLGMITCRLRSVWLYRSLLLWWSSSFTCVRIGRWSEGVLKRGCVHNERGLLEKMWSIVDCLSPWRHVNQFCGQGAGSRLNVESESFIPPNSVLKSPPQMIGSSGYLVEMA